MMLLISWFVFSNMRNFSARLRIVRVKPGYGLKGSSGRFKSFATPELYSCEKI